MFSKQALRRLILPLIIEQFLAVMVGMNYAFGLALAAPDGTWVRKIQQGLGRERVRHVSASHAFDLTRRYLSGLEVK